MTIRFLIPALVVLVASVAAATATEIRHDIEVRLDPPTARLDVTDRIRLPAGQRLFRLSPGLTVTEATVDGAPLPIERRGEELRLSLPKDGEVLLRYGGILPNPAGVAPESSRAPAGKEGAFLPAGSGWLPRTGGTDDDPPAWRLAVRVPDPFLAVATGKLVEESKEADGYRAVFAEDRPVEEPSLFAGVWQMREKMHGTVRLRSYFHPEQAGLSDPYLDLSARAIDGYSTAIGDYPFDGFSIVSVGPPVGLGFPGLTAIGRSVLPLPFIRSQSLAHEILHNWWGNGVRAGEGGNWSEGLTTYMADHASAEDRHPDAGRALRLDWLRDYAALPVGRDEPVTSFRTKTHDASQIIGYGKVAMIFHMLKAEVGEEAFTRGVRLFWQRHRFDDAGWNDIRLAFEAVSDRPLGGFFSAWLDRAGAPSLTLAMARVQGNSLTLTLRQEGDLYPLAVPIVVTTAAGAERHVVRLDEREVTTTLKTQAPPRSMIVDPDIDLFRRLAPGEVPPILRDVTLDPAARMIVAAEGPAAEAARTLGTRLLDGRPTVAADDPRTPLLVIGTAGEVARILAAKGLPGEPELLAGRGSARVWTLRAPSGRSVLAIAGQDAVALQALLRPLPHYGRQSWLVFDGAQAIDRGIWPAGQGSLSRHFN